MVQVRVVEIQEEFDNKEEKLVRDFNFFGSKLKKVVSDRRRSMVNYLYFSNNSLKSISACYITSLVTFWSNKKIQGASIIKDDLLYFTLKLWISAIIIVNL